MGGPCPMHKPSQAAEPENPLKAAKPVFTPPLQYCICLAPSRRRLHPCATVVFTGSKTVARGLQRRVHRRQPSSLSNPSRSLLSDHVVLAFYSDTHLMIYSHVASPRCLFFFSLQIHSSQVTISNRVSILPLGRERTALT